MTSTSSAIAAAMPSPTCGLDHSMPRRGFLAGLATLPLIGGSVALLGAPSAVAELATPDLLEAYKTWLHYEERFLCWEMAADPVCRARYRPLDGGSDQKAFFGAIRGSYFHGSDAGHFHDSLSGSQPSARAALVLSAVGCDWREDERQRRSA